jgi:cytoskeleton protein RodZ
MTVNDTSSSEVESLGRLLQRRRTEKGIDLSHAAEETRIPPSTLEAMEGSDYANQPADAFARGFYTIYARLLDLNVEEVLERYTQERSTSLKHQKNHFKSSSVLGNTASPMAERPLLTPLSMLACGLVIIILLLVGFSWFFSWNPANFLSDKLRSFGKPPAVEQKTDSHDSSAAPAPADAPPTHQISAVQGHPRNDQTAGAPPAAIQYTLRAEFQDPTKLTVTVDDEFPEEISFSAGQNHTWYAKHALTMILPSQTTTRLTVNGAPAPLPAPVDGFITVFIPGFQSQ